MSNLLGIVHYSILSFVSSHAVYTYEQVICHDLSSMDVVVLQAV
jgi:hypothetical protein